MANVQTPPYITQVSLHGESRNGKPPLPTIYDGSSHSEDSDSESRAVGVESASFLAVQSPALGLTSSTMTGVKMSKSDPSLLMPKSVTIESKTVLTKLCTTSSPSLPESSTSPCDNDGQKESGLLSRSSTSTLSTLTSLSEERNEANSKSENPSAHLDYLRHVHKRTRRRKRLRKYLKILHFFVVCVIPLASIVLGILGIITGHFLHVNSFLVAGCLLLIAACGLILQSCFWNRSMPNKFKAAEIAFNMPPEGSPDVIKACTTQQPMQADMSQGEQKSSKEDLPGAAQNGGKRASTLTAISARVPGTTLTFSADSLATGVNPAQVRRLSIALNRATEELSAARRMTQSSGDRMLNLARRLTMGP
ncbi:unnamed protein product, partial [Dibothriocephalus latus]